MALLFAALVACALASNHIIDSFNSASLSGLWIRSSPAPAFAQLTVNCEEQFDGSRRGVQIQDTSATAAAYISLDNLAYGADGTSLLVNVRANDSTGVSELFFYQGTTGAYALRLNWAAGTLSLVDYAGFPAVGAELDYYLSKKPVSVATSVWYTLQVEFYDDDVTGTLWQWFPAAPMQLLAVVSAPVRGRAFGSNIGLRGTGSNSKCFDDFRYNDGARVRGDPHFFGFSGERYNVAGESGKVYSLLSDDHIQVNARYREGCARKPEDARNADLERIRQRPELIPADKASHVHPSLIEAVSVLYKYHTIVFDQENLLVDGAPLQLSSESFQMGEGESGMNEWIRRVSQNRVEVVTDQYSMMLTRRAVRCGGARIDVQIRARNTELSPHGLLGQTLGESNRKRAVSVMPTEWPHQGEGVIEGTYTDYEVADLTDTDFVFTRNARALKNKRHM